jgi:hypothetical protein
MHTTPRRRGGEVRSLSRWCGDGWWLISCSSRHLMCFLHLLVSWSICILHFALSCARGFPISQSRADFAWREGKSQNLMTSQRERSTDRCCRPTTNERLHFVSWFLWFSCFLFRLPSHHLIHPSNSSNPSLSSWKRPSLHKAYNIQHTSFDNGTVFYHCPRCGLVGNH